MTVSLADLLAGRIVESAAFSTATGATPKSRRAVIPASLYARYVVRSSLESQIEHAENFLQLLKVRHLKPVGDLYIHDLMSYSRVDTHEGYLSKLLIRVERTE